jgi:hypothetical protein
MARQINAFLAVIVQEYDLLNETAKVLLASNQDVEIIVPISDLSEITQSEQLEEGEAQP